MDGLDEADARIRSRGEDLPLGMRSSPTLSNAELAQALEDQISGVERALRRLTTPDGTPKPGMDPQIIDGYKFALANYQATVDSIRQQQAERRLLAARALENYVNPDLAGKIVTGSGFSAVTVEEALSMY